MAKKKKKATPRRGKRNARLLLRAVIDDLERGKCGTATQSLVEAAARVPSRGKLKKHLEAVTRAFTSACIRGGGGFNVPQAARMPAQPNPFSKLYQHAGPRGPLPGARPPQHGGSAHVPQSSDAKWYGSHSRSHVTTPSSHVHPFVDGLGRWTRYKRRR